MEHIVDDEVAGKDDEKGHCGDGNYCHRVNDIGYPCPGVTPVDAGVDVVITGGLALIAVVGQNLIQVLLDVAGTAFQHHIQAPCAGYPVSRGFWVYSHLVENRVHPALGDENVIGHDGLVVFPPAG